MMAFDLFVFVDGNNRPIYKIYLNRFRDAWYTLSDEERNGFIGKHNTAFAELGIKDTVFCDASWSTEQWDFGGVEWGWHRYVDAMVVLGTKIDDASA